MTADDFLRIQLRLLSAHFGRRRVLDALAGLSDAPPEQLLEQISRLEAAKRSKTPKREKSLDELIASLSGVTESVRGLVARLGRFYESRVFLPNLRDAEEFLRRRGEVSRKFKSRRRALGAVLEALSSMPTSELESMVAQNASATEQSDYAILADQLMGKKH